MKGARALVEELKMKLKRDFLILVVCVFAWFFLFSTTSGLAVAEVSITGTVYAENWDDKDNVTEVVIETADGEPYYVSNDGRGKELLKLVEKKVKATGVVEDTGGEKIIRVMAYEVME